MPLDLRRRARAQAPLLTVVTVVAAVVVYLSVEPDHWRRGVALIAVMLVLAGVLRATLTRSRAGLLAVRGRWFDVACYVGLGVVLLITDLRLQS